MEAKNPGWQAILLPAEAVDQVVDGCGLVNVEEVCRKVAYKEGHNDGQEDGSQSAFLVHVEVS